jgi:23S rRNA (adenine2030-N6)-methyltransferase
MNYRHAYHAGNFADVLKHAALIAVLLHLRKKESPFAVIDTHGGRGLYDLGGAEAEKTAEARDGIVRLMAMDTVPGVLDAYRELVRRFGAGVYPGSPLVAAKLLRAKDRLVAVEKHPEEYEALTIALAGIGNARTVPGDGYRQLKRLLPPPERRGVVLIDPPFETESEFQDAVRALIDAHRRFATGIYLFWYPAKREAEVAAASGELLNAGITSLLQLTLDVGAVPAKEGRGAPLTATGLLVVNPPYRFKEEMDTMLPFLAAHLAQGPGAAAAIMRLAG